MFVEIVGHVVRPLLLFILSLVAIHNQTNLFQLGSSNPSIFTITDGVSGNDESTASSFVQDYTFADQSISDYVPSYKAFVSDALWWIKSPWSPVILNPEPLVKKQSSMSTLDQLTLGPDNQRDPSNTTKNKTYLGQASNDLKWLKVDLMDRYNHKSLGRLKPLAVPQKGYFLKDSLYFTPYNHQYGSLHGITVFWLQVTIVIATFVFGYRAVAAHQLQRKYKLSSRAVSLILISPVILLELLNLYGCLIHAPVIWKYSARDKGLLQVLKMLWCAPLFGLNRAFLLLQHDLILGTFLCATVSTFTWNYLMLMTTKTFFPKTKSEWIAWIGLTGLVVYLPAVSFLITAIRTGSLQGSFSQNSSLMSPKAGRRTALTSVYSLYADDETINSVVPGPVSHPVNTHTGANIENENDEIVASEERVQTPCPNTLNDALAPLIVPLIAPLSSSSSSSSNNAKNGGYLETDKKMRELEATVQVLEQSLATQQETESTSQKTIAMLQAKLSSFEREEHTAELSNQFQELKLQKELWQQKAAELQQLVEKFSGTSVPVTPAQSEKQLTNIIGEDTGGEISEFQSAYDTPLMAKSQIIDSGMNVNNDLNLNEGNFLQDTKISGNLVSQQPSNESFLNDPAISEFLEQLKSELVASVTQSKPKEATVSELSHLISASQQYPDVVSSSFLVLFREQEETIMQLAREKEVAQLAFHDLEVDYQVKKQELQKTRDKAKALKQEVVSLKKDLKRIMQDVQFFAEKAGGGGGTSESDFQ